MCIRDQNSKLSKSKRIGKLLIGRSIGTMAATIAVVILFWPIVGNLHPEFAQGVIIGAGVTVVGGVFLMMKEIVSKTIDIIIGDD